MTTDALDCHSRPALFSRVHGAAGPTVLCLHSSTGSQGQWRGLAAALSELARVITPDLHGHGRSPAWPVGQATSLHIDAPVSRDRRHTSSWCSRATLNSNVTRASGGRLRRQAWIDCGVMALPFVQ